MMTLITGTKFFIIFEDGRLLPPLDLDIPSLTQLNISCRRSEKQGPGQRSYYQISTKAGVDLEESCLLEISKKYPNAWCVSTSESWADLKDPMETSILTMRNGEIQNIQHWKHLCHDLTILIMALQSSLSSAEWIRCVSEQMSLWFQKDGGEHEKLLNHVKTMQEVHFQKTNGHNFNPQAYANRGGCIKHLIQEVLSLPKEAFQFLDPQKRGPMLMACAYLDLVFHRKIEDGGHFDKMSKLMGIPDLYHRLILVTDMQILQSSRQWIDNCKLINGAAAHEITSRTAAPPLDLDDFSLEGDLQ